MRFWHIVPYRAIMPYSVWHSLSISPSFCNRSNILSPILQSQAQLYCTVYIRVDVSIGMIIKLKTYTNTYINPLYTYLLDRAVIYLLDENRYKKGVRYRDKPLDNIWHSVTIWHHLSRSGTKCHFIRSTNLVTYNRGNI